MFGQLSDTYNRIMAMNNLGGIALNQGQLAEALTFYQDGVALAHQIGGSAWMVGVFEMNLGTTHLRLGQSDIALQHLDASEAQFKQAGSRDFLPELMRHRAEALLLAENLAAAESIIQEAFQLAEEQESQSELGCSQRVLGEILLHKTLPGKAVLELEKSVTILATVGEEYELARSRFVLARAVWLAHEDKEQVLSLLKQSLDVFTRLEAKLDLTAVQSFRQAIDD